MKKRKIHLGVCVSHGKTTHAMGEPCKVCEEIEKEFNEAVERDEIGKALASLEE